MQLRRNKVMCNHQYEDMIAEFKVFCCQVRAKLRI